LAGHPAAILHRLVGGGDGVEDEVVDPALVLGRERLVGIEGARHVRAAAAAAIHPGDLAGHLAGVVGRIEGADAACAGLAGEAVGAQIIDEAGLLGDLLGIGVEMLDDDLTDAFKDVGHQLGPSGLVWLVVSARPTVKSTVAGVVWFGPPGSTSRYGWRGLDH